MLGLVGLHRTVQLQLLQHWWGIDLDYCESDEGWLRGAGAASGGEEIAHVQACI